MNLLEELSAKGVGEKHVAVLRKFATLQGTIIRGEEEIRGTKGSTGCPPDIFVKENHRLHGLVRGIYVPEDDEFALSVLLTEKRANYGRELTYFSPSKWRISYRPPRDKSAERDTRALKRCLDLEIPVGVLHNLRKGVNRILGLGKIIDFGGSAFSIVPLRLGETASQKLEQLALEQIKQKVAAHDYSAPDNKTTVVARAGQKWFRDQLLVIYDHECGFCGFGMEDFLIAAHITPYSKDRKNRINPQNGLLLCRLCDQAFEKGYVRLEKDMRIVRSGQLDVVAQRSVPVASWMSHIRSKLQPRVATFTPSPDLIAERDVLMRQR